LETLLKFTLEVKVHYIKRSNLHPLSSTFTSKYLYSLCCPVRIYTDFIFLSFRLKAKKQKKKNRDSKGKSFSSLVLSEHDIPTIPCTLCVCVCVCVSARQKGKNLGVQQDEWVELLFLPFRKKSRISGRKCLLVSERTAKSRNKRERESMPLKRIIRPRCIQEFRFTYSAALRYVNVAHANSFNTLL
jgi:hypothetical protein